MSQNRLRGIPSRPRQGEAVAQTHAATTVDAKGQLWALLDRWAGIDEATWPQQVVDRLKGEILTLFRNHPEADGWFREWRVAHPEARLV